MLLIFASQKLEPMHRILVLKLAMNKLKKSYTKQARMCALELIKVVKEVREQLEDADDIIGKAEKILVGKEVKGDSVFINGIESLEDVKVDWVKTEIVKG